MNNITELEFKNKKNNKIEISNEVLKKASEYAYLEAKKWDSASNILYRNRLDTQACVNALFAIELYLKSILMNQGINVTKESYNHNIYKMYNAIPDNIKNKISLNIKIDSKLYISMTDELIEFETFEDELEFISNDFMYLRYEYEKYLKGKKIIMLSEFIIALKDNCRNVLKDS